MEGPGVQRTRGIISLTVCVWVSDSEEAAKGSLPPLLLPQDCHLREPSAGPLALESCSPPSASNGGKPQLAPSPVSPRLSDTSSRPWVKATNWIDLERSHSAHPSLGHNSSTDTTSPPCDTLGSYHSRPTEWPPCFSWAISHPLHPVTTARTLHTLKNSNSE